MSHLQKWRKTKNKDTLLKGLGQERWLKKKTLFFLTWYYKDDNTDITRQDRPHFSPDPFCPPVGTKHVAFLVTGRSVQDRLEIPPIPSCCVSKQICHIVAVCSLVLEYSEFCKWLPDSLGICEIQRNKIQLKKYKNPPKNPKTKQKPPQTTTKKLKQTKDRCIDIVNSIQGSHTNMLWYILMNQKETWRQAHVNESERFWRHASSKTEFDTHFSHHYKLICWGLHFSLSKLHKLKSSWL